MTFDQFLNKWDKKPINPDGIYGQQCVDVIKQYFVDCIGIPAIRNNGVDYWTNYPKSHFTRIANTPSFVPKKGDIMVWSTSVGKYGHVAIVINANVNTFTSFDQNWPFDDGKGVAHFQPHNYKGVFGVLRPNKDVNFDQVVADAEARANADAQAKLQAEADRVAKEEAERVAIEQAKLAEEQAKLEAELLKQAEAKAEAEKENKMIEKLSGLLKGYRTYIADAVLVLVALQALLPQLTVIPAEWTAPVVVVLGALVALFRKLA
jgi:hypothetical protein